MKSIEQNFAVKFNYGVHFTEGLFELNNPLLKDTLCPDDNTLGCRVLFVVDSGVVEAHPQLINQLKAYTTAHKEQLALTSEPLILPGGEEAKNNPALLEKLLAAINTYGICRHSYLVAIGGGALLDLAGFAAAIAHRGVRLVRVPTTVLSQNDSGVGVKNGVNAFGKKNFIGTFAPPVAVLNDSIFLQTLDDRDWRAGIAEAIKVALIKDAAFYQAIKSNAKRLATRDMIAMQGLIHRCAELHVEHIGGADPFEFGSSRPLDFGHWAAHKLEQLTNYRLRHGEAVAIGIALDVTYSYLQDMITETEYKDVLSLLTELGFKLYVPELSQMHARGQYEVIRGLQEFREHLGGQLTIMLLNKIGVGVEVNHMEESTLIESIQKLENIQSQFTSASENLNHHTENAA